MEGVESYEQFPEKGGDYMDPMDVQKEFEEIAQELHDLHEGNKKDMPKTDREGSHAEDMVIITKDHPIFGEFISEGDEVLHLDKHSQEELARLELALFDEKIAEDERKVLFKNFFDYCVAKNRVLSR